MSIRADMGDSDSEPQQAVYVDGMNGGGYATRLFLAPWDGRRNSKGQYIGPALFSTSTLVALVLEFLFSFVLGFAVVAARFYTSLGAGGNGLQDGFFIGAVHAIVWLTAWLWARDYNLKRYLNWAFLAGQLLKFRIPVQGSRGSVQGPDYGILAFILYGGVQLGGAAVAGTLLLAFGLGNLPNPTNTLLSAEAGSAITAAQGPVALATLTGVADGLIWFVEFFGVAIIVLANIYNDERHQDKNNNAGDARENEIDNHRRTGEITALAILAMTTILYPLGSYSFGNVPYFAGLVAVGTGTISGTTGGNSYAGNPPGTPLIDWAHYLFTPVAGGAAGALVGFLVSWLLGLHPAERSVNGMRMVGSRSAWRSAKTPLLQRPSKLASAGQQPQQRARQRTPLAVRAFE